ncbi:MAG: hypothetical protein U5N85_06330 [Arcicella sp.]|nr:hypothetical protein [Arcicella sp.]
MKLSAMKSSVIKLITISIFWTTMFILGCKSNTISPEACVKVSESLRIATKTYDTTSSLAKDTTRKRAACVAYRVALQNFITVSYANGCITVSDTINYKRMLANAICK